MTAPLHLAHLVEHSHPHGNHEHVHTHVVAENDGHVHGWHGTAEHCGGDDTFGVETNPLPPTIGEVPIADVYVPFVQGMLHESVLPAIRRELPEGQRVATIEVGHSQYDYHELVRQVWARGNDFVLVEHDNEIPAGCLAGFAACPELLCVHDYAVYGGKIQAVYGRPGGFGCTRFRSSMMKSFPSILDDLTDRTWSHLDGNILSRLWNLGVEPHRHYPDAIHHHEYGDGRPAPGTIAMIGYEHAMYPADRAREALQQLATNREAIMKPPEDVARYQRIIDTVQPSIVIETGLAYGGSARWFAERVARVLVIEIEPALIAQATEYGLPHNVLVYQGDSASSAAAYLADHFVRSGAPGAVLVVLDSDHHEAHVRAELDLYARLVTAGSYCVVEDTMMHYVRDANQGDPMPAAVDFAAAHADEWEVDTELETMSELTFMPKGWLRRKALL